VCPHHRHPFRAVDQDLHGNRKRVGFARGSRYPFLQAFPCLVEILADGLQGGQSFGTKITQSDVPQRLFSPIIYRFAMQQSQKVAFV
jgi:hypothetical protein